MPARDLDRHAGKFGAELDGRPCFVDRVVALPEGRVRQRYFLDGSAYPPELVTSARAVVFRGPKVVVVRDRAGARHIQPGGHIEHGETVEQALRRELVEETGWRVGELVPFGFSFVEPLTPAGASADLRSGGAVHRLFIAEATSYHRSARDMTQVEVGSSLVSVPRALRQLADDQAKLLRAARRHRHIALVSSVGNTSHGG